MNRRNFLSLAALAIAGSAAERVFPFRVYSIPKKIVTDREAIQTYADFHMKEAMRQFDDALKTHLATQRWAQFYSGSNHIYWDRTAKQFTAPQSYRS